MDIFWRLVLAHLLADFTLQTDYVNRMKRIKAFGMFIHVMTHAFVSAVIVSDYLYKPWFTILNYKVYGWLALVLLTLVHFLVDEIRVYLIKRLGYMDNTFNFLCDQFAHIYFIFMFSPFDFKTASFIPEKWIFIAICLVMVSHFMTVFFYFIEKDISNAAFPQFDQKYFMILERVIIWSFFLIPGLWWMALLFIWIAQLFYVKRKRIMDMSNLDLYGSIVFSTIFGFVSRLVYYG